MKIVYKKRKEIDFRMWDAAIDADPRALPYAYSWYLEVSTQSSWNALVSENYELVFPLPYNLKIPFYPQLFCPVLTQQLGLFGAQSSFEKQELFVHQIPDFYKKVQYPLGAFHSDDPPINNHKFDSTFSMNLLLKLNKAYTDLHQSYNRSLKRTLKKASSQLMIRPLEEVHKVFDYYKTHLKDKVKLSSTEWQRVLLILKEIHKRGMALMVEAVDKEEQIVGRAFFVKTRHRIINLFGANNDRGRKLGAMPAMVDAIIQQHAHQDITFDFEGSNIEGIYFFFASFGAYPCQYQILSHNALPCLVNKAMDFRNNRKQKE